MTHFLKIALVMIFSAVTSTTHAQLSKDSIKSLLESRQFRFVPTSTDALNTRFVNGTFVVKMNKKVLSSDLPYFGHNQSAPMTPTDGGLIFTTKKFEYDLKPAVQDSWYLLLTIKGVPDVSTYALSVYSNGTAELLVKSNFRNQVSFKGWIAALTDEDLDQ